MPQIGWFELLIVASIAIIVVGPKDFPIMLRKIGSWIGSAKRYVSNIQNEFSSLENDESLNNKKNNEIEKKKEKDDFK